ncbi:hypothetical protein [Yoonia sp. 208BN28-4]|uniref:hypothetical protein n=1 Tax=Yoonia sp. 208BN28-4 TaxID=3126505 RepID=UPI00309E0EFA
MNVRHALFLAVFAGLSAPVFADPYEPARGTAERRAILDGIRPLAEDGLGAPVEFVVNTLQVDNGRGFAMLEAQRPGGAPIDISQSPMVLRDGEPEWSIDGPTVTAFVVRMADGAWRVDEYAIGATDVWWAGDPYCADYASVLPAMVCN